MNVSAQICPGKHEQPDYRTRLQRLAEKGKIRELIEELGAGSIGHTVGAAWQVALLRRALSVCARDHNAGVAGALIESCIEFDASLLLRAQVVAKSKMHAWDRRDHKLGDPPQDVIREDLPRLAALEDRIVLLAKALATVRHTLALADESEGSPCNGPKTRQQARDGVRAQEDPRKARHTGACVRAGSARWPLALHPEASRKA